MNTYNGEPVADPGKFIRLTLRGHYVRWRLERELANPAATHGLLPQVEAHGRRAVAAG